MPKFEVVDVVETETTTTEDIVEIKAQPIQRKARKFSEKYSKGKQVGTGPFGHVYKCWVRNDILVAAAQPSGGEDGAVDDPFKNE